MKTDLVALQLTADPLQFTMSERKSFNMTMAVTNQGTEIVDPEPYRVKLFVNGVESVVWTLAIGNCRLESRWSALPPGESVSQTWSSMGESLFPSPGDFVLVIYHEDIGSVPIHVLVQTG